MEWGHGEVRKTRVRVVLFSLLIRIIFCIFLNECELLVEVGTKSPVLATSGWNIIGGVGPHVCSAVPTHPRIVVANNKLKLLRVSY